MATAHLLSSWFVELPAMIYCMFYASWTDGVAGNQWGKVFGAIGRLIIMLYFMVTTDWGKQSNLARQRSMRGTRATSNLTGQPSLT